MLVVGDIKTDKFLAHKHGDDGGILLSVRELDWDELGIKKDLIVYIHDHDFAGGFSWCDALTDLQSTDYSTPVLCGEVMSGVFTRAISIAMNRVI